MSKLSALLCLAALSSFLAACSDNESGAGAGGAGSPGPGGTASTGGSAPPSGGAGSGPGVGGVGGAPGSGGSTGGGSVGGAAAGSGGIVGCAADCGSHKWACWPVPSAPGSNSPHPASYTDMGEIVHDDITCLDWETSPPETTRSNDDALAYCEGLSLGGHDDWRLPTRVELASIVDVAHSPALDPVFSGAGGFHKTGSNWVLTIDQNGAGEGTDFAWAYNLSDGIVSNARSAATPDRARCVRGNGTGEAFSDKPSAPPNHYSELSADAVRDNYTGLIWERDGDGSGLVSWEEAASYCENLSIGGSGDWRLPSVRELSSLVDEARVAPSIDVAMFPNTHYGARSDNWYWAIESARSSASAHWALNFDDGFTGFNAGADGAWNHFALSYAKCVH